MRWVKRIGDVVISATVLLLTLPAQLAVAVAVWASMGRPVLFRQVRPGRHGKPFTLVKFRTMRNALDAAGTPLPDADRLTGVGRFLRKTSLDELPQLWNVLAGQMSLVGPRPLLMEYLPLYSPRQAKRHEVRPGITGWAQVKGRNLLSWEERFELDVWYVEHWSVGLDVKIAAMTFAQVFRGTGVSPQGQATMPKFTGSSPGSAENATPRAKPQASCANGAEPEGSEGD